MTIAVTYKVDMNLYTSPTANRNITLITTEYMCKTNILVHIQMNKNTAISTNRVLEAHFHLKRRLESDLFFCKKTYNMKAVKSITKPTFEERFSKFPKDETTITKEILEQYNYHDKNGKAGEVQILLTQREAETTAVIDFKSKQQCDDFVAPDWLGKYEK